MTTNQGATVLVVDDCDDTRSLIGAMLRQAGYQVREARSGADPARVAAERPDVIVRCVNGDPKVAVGPVLELSAGDRGSREGVDARLTLPATPGQLATTVEAVLRVHRWEVVRRSLFDLMLDAVVITDDTGRLLDVNESSCVMFGALKTEVVGRRLGEFLDRGVDFDQAWQTLREWGWRAGEFRLVRADGMVREVEYVARANVLPGRHLAMLRDITRRKQWEATAGALIEVGRLMSETPDVRQVARRIAESTRSLLGVQNAAVCRLDPESGDLVVLALARDEAEVLDEGFVFPRGSGAVGAAVRERRPIASPDVCNDPRVLLPPELRAGVERSRRRAILALPLMVEGTVIGALAARDRHGRMFDAEAIGLASAFADQAALALEKARLAEEQARLLEETRRQREEAVALEAVARSITSSLERDEVLQRIVDETRALCDCDIAFLAPYDPVTDSARIVAASGSRSRALFTTAITRGRGVAGKVLETGESFTTEDYANDPRISKDYLAVAIEEGTVTQAAVPLRSRGAIVGLLCVANRSPKRFTPAEVRVLERLADQAAIAMENSQLYAALSQHAARLRALREIDQGILTASSPRAIAETALRHLSGLAPCWRASVTMFDVETGEGRILAVVGGAQSVVPPGSPSSITREDVEYLQLGKVRLVRDVEASDEVPLMVRALQGEGLRAYLRVPLLVDGELVGSLNLSSDRPNAFTAAHVEIAIDVGESLAVALQQARLSDEARAGRERLRTLSRRLVDVQEAERRHIARELHDEIGQLLTGLKLALEKGGGGPDGTIRTDLRAATELVTDLIARVRNLSLDLRPAMLDDLGLVPSLVWHFERYTGRTDVRVDFEHVGVEGRRFPPEIETAAYRIVQEALTNVARHAGVMSATVRLWAHERIFGVQIEDKGVGFAPDVATAPKGGGVIGMRERVALLGGRFELESSPAAGARLTAEIPLP